MKYRTGRIVYGTDPNGFIHFDSARYEEYEHGVHWTKGPYASAYARQARDERNLKAAAPCT